MNELKKMLVMDIVGKIWTWGERKREEERNERQREGE